MNAVWMIGWFCFMLTICILKLIIRSDLCTNPYSAGSDKQMCLLVKERKNTILIKKINESVHEKVTQTFVPDEVVGNLTCSCKSTNRYCDHIRNPKKLCVLSLLHVESNHVLWFTKLLDRGLTILNEWLEHIHSVLVIFVLIFMWKITLSTINVILCFTPAWWRNFFKWPIQLSSPSLLIDVLKHGDNISSDLSAVQCVDDDLAQRLLFTSIFRSIDKDQATKEMGNSLQRTNFDAEPSGLSHSTSKSLNTVKSNSKYLPPKLEDSSIVQHSGSHAEPVAGSGVETTGYTTDKLPSATTSLDRQYPTGFDKDKSTVSTEETRKRASKKEKVVHDHNTVLESSHKNQISLNTAGNKSPPPASDKAISSFTGIASVNKSYRSLPRRAYLLYLNERYDLDSDQLSLPKATKFLVKVRTQIVPGRYMARLQLHCSSKDDRLPNLDATVQAVTTTTTTSNEQAALPVRERKHFPSNVNKTGHIMFSSDLGCFSGSIQYPLPTKKAVASRIGYGGNAVVFVVFYSGKEYAVKKTVYRSKEISVHSQLCHPNIINLEAVLVGEKHERHRDKHYVYCFMQKMDINFRNVLSTKDYGCLKHLKVQLNEKREQWELVLVNVKHVLRSVLKALEYMHSQGLVHRDVKASNILTCHCTEVLFCNCHQGKFLGDFDSSATVPGYQLQLEEHQMIRYASVLPLGTMGYRAPEVSMHLVLSGPYETLYTTSVDIWSFGCLLLTVFIGKSGPLKQRGEASLLLSAQDHPYSQELYNKVIKINEVQKHYCNTPGVCDLVQKCLQVQPHCRPTAQELLELDFFKY